MSIQYNIDQHIVVYVSHDIDQNDVHYQVMQANMENRYPTTECIRNDRQIKTTSLNSTQSQSITTTAHSSCKIICQKVSVVVFIGDSAIINVLGCL